MKTYIKLTTIGAPDHPVWVESESPVSLITTANGATFITMTNGRDLLIKETPEEILNLLRESVGLRPQSVEGDAT